VRKNSLELDDFWGLVNSFFIYILLILQYYQCMWFRLTVLLTESWQSYLTLDGEHSNTSAVVFSPQANFLCTWRMLYAKAPNQAKQSSNMFILDLNAKTIVAEFIDKGRQNW